MARSHAKKRKRRTDLQQNGLIVARDCRALRLQHTKELNTELCLRKQILNQEYEGTQLAMFVWKAKKAKEKYWSERRRSRRMEKALAERKLEIKGLKDENKQLIMTVERLKKDKADMEEDIQQVLATFSSKILLLTNERRELLQEQVRLKTRCHTLKKTTKLLTERVRTAAGRKGVFRMTDKGIYTKQAREMARYLASVGTAEKNIGVAITRIGKMIGMEVDRTMSERTVQRAILESGVAAEIQLGYEMAKSDKISYSSDSTSHRHIEYESRSIAVKVVDYTQPDAEPQWKIRSLGIDTSVNHTSETQINGLHKRLAEIARIFNESPLAKREKLVFYPDDFVYRLIGTSGDHAADQKKGHEILGEWKIDVILRRLGEEAIFALPATRVVAYLLPFKLRLIEELGGYSQWEKLNDDEKAALDVKIVREIGLEVFQCLSKTDQEKLTRFIRTGCCMHKDLNTFKWGDKAMQNFWILLRKTPPILLANKDNAAVLNGHVDLSDLTAVEKRAAEVSKRGASHATMLGGMICRNKDKKKGQQDTYNFFMETRISEPIPYPDVSNTRYGTHGEAAALITVYRKEFVAFMGFVRDGKEKPGLTNIEKNFLAALEDGPTFVEFCILIWKMTSHSVALSRDW
ncbi:hypothetical protein Hypma_001834 [Hypsizygus marmoreus]|uniref:Uncharacterized protein n=1 Tax=Hypsizygus marmoreus TaxID=39966 RepID=A0A369JES6_HYPMA|nr:hypothetical protein Hypma_001834 [Hypsizygus marmoreus]